MQDRRGRDFVQDRRGDIVQDENGTIREGLAPRKQQTGADQRQMLFWEAPGALGEDLPEAFGSLGRTRACPPFGPGPRGGHARVLPKPTPKKGRRGGSPFWRPCGPHNMRVQKVARDGVKYDTLCPPPQRLQRGSPFWKPPGARKIRVKGRPGQRKKRHLAGLPKKGCRVAALFGSPPAHVKYRSKRAPGTV